MFSKMFIEICCKEEVCKYLCSFPVAGVFLHLAGLTLPWVPAEAHASYTWALQ